MIISNRNTFNRASLRNSVRTSGSRVRSEPLRQSFRDSGAVRLTLGDAAKTHRAADLVRAKADKHYEKHREKWVNKRFAKLLVKHGNTLSLTPSGITADPKAGLMARAGREIAARQIQRLQRIDKARDKALNGQPLRTSRKMQWGKGLGE